MILRDLCKGSISIYYHINKLLFQNFMNKYAIKIQYQNVINFFENINNIILFICLKNITINNSI